MNNKIKYPLCDLKREHQYFGGKTLEAIGGIIEKADFIQGGALERFEGAFARYCGVKYCIGVGSGTSALFLSLKAAGVGEGDGVIIPAHTFRATATAILMAGAVPELVDIDPVSGNINPGLIEKSITPVTKAIIPVHLYGRPADMDEINRTAGSHNLAVIEDACEAHGAVYKDRKAGSLGKTGCFSFYPSKNLGCYGDGGAVVTDDDEIADKIRAMRGYGAKGLPGYNSRLATIQAAVLNVKLSELDNFIKKRKEAASHYNRFLEGLPVETPQIQPGEDHVYYLYVIKTSEEARDSLIKHLREKGIEARIHFETTIHLDPVFTRIKGKKGGYPEAEIFTKKIISLPMHPFLSEEEIMEICGEIKNFYNRVDILP